MYNGVNAPGQSTRLVDAGGPAVNDDKERVLDSWIVILWFVQHAFDRGAILAFQRTTSLCATAQPWIWSFIRVIFFRLGRPWG